MHMLKLLSCSVSVCEDNDEQCSSWASTGECDINPEWMHENCKKSCDKCDDDGGDGGGGGDDSEYYYISYWQSLNS